MHPEIKELIESYEDLTIMDGYDDCILGVAERFGQPPYIVYDYHKVIHKLMLEGMSMEEAYEWYDYNMIGAYVGESTPAFIKSHE